MGMAPVERKDISFDEEAKAGFKSLIQQTCFVFIGFVLMLLITRGEPSSLIVALSFCFGVIFVTWSEQRRIKNLRVATTSATDKLVSEEQEDIVSDSDPIEWNILQWFDNKIVPEAAKQIGGWSLIEAEVYTELERITSLKEWILEQIPLPAFSQQQEKQRNLVLEKNIHIRGINYILRISYIGRNHWRFDLETPRPGMNIPTDFKLYLVNTSGKNWVRKVIRASKNQEILSIKVFIPEGTGIIWDIEPKPENYVNEILRF